MFHVPEKYRMKECKDKRYNSDESFGNNGVFLLNAPELSRPLRVIASDGMGWEHVSVSLHNRNPSWNEMCYVKNLFWDQEDCVVQYHPPKSVYKNVHQYTLHLWRPIGVEIPLPDLILV